MRISLGLLIILELCYMPLLMAESSRSVAFDGESESTDAATEVNLVEETGYADHSHRREEYVSNDMKEVTVFDPRIVGGTYASSLNQDTSYVVSLQDRNSNHYCGATLITRDCIITAAHCTNAATGKGPITAVVGRTKLSDVTRGERKQIAVEMIHPSYDLTKVGVQWKYDFALMCFKKPASAKLKVLPLNTVSATPRETSLVQVFGWGDTNKDPNIREVSDELKVAKLRVVASDTCETSYQGYSLGSSGKAITNDMMCAMHRTQDSCQGDSGGPLVFNGKIVGITSWGVDCNNRNFPGVYARISFGYSWIREKICLKSKFRYDNPNFLCEEIWRL